MPAPSRKSPLWWATAAVLMAPIVYVLSIGPVACLYEIGMTPEPVACLCDVIYEPLNWFYNDGPEPFRTGLQSYLWMWRVRK